MWVCHDIRDEIVDFVGYWSCKTEINISCFIRQIGISSSKFYDWKRRYGRVNEHNCWIPRDFWLEEWEKDAIERFYLSHPDEGYRGLAFMMLDSDVACVSLSSVYRVLKERGYLRKWNTSKSKKGSGFNAPTRPHEHWHIDISYLNIRGTFYYLCTVLDGYSRYIVHWEIRESMRERDACIILQRAREKFPRENPKIISDNGPQFISKEFKEFIRISGMNHVKTSPYYPQSNGKIERWHQSLKRECIRPLCPISLKEAIKIVKNFVEYYNTRRLHSAIGYIVPKDKLQDRDKEIFESRDRKLELARKMRKIRRKRQKESLLVCEKTLFQGQS